MIQIIVVAASIILGMILYPTLLKKVNNLVNWWYWNMGAGSMEKGANKVHKPEPESSKISSVIGESKTKIGHDRTKATTNPKNAGVEEKDSTFASKTAEETNQIADVEVPLEKVETLTEEEFDPDQEMVELEAERGAVLASGAGYDELMNAGEVIVKAKPSDQEKDEAGRVLFESRNTQLFEQMMASSDKMKDSITSVIEFHLAKQVKKENKSGEETDIPNDFKDFDIDSIF